MYYVKQIVFSFRVEMNYVFLVFEVLPAIQNKTANAETKYGNIP
jgi:hypothetical protein